MRRRAALSWLLLGCTLAGPGRGERELTTDRPDATESPFTVEPGRAQWEVSVVAYERDRPQEGDAVETWSVTPVNLRLGVSPRWEIALVFDGGVEQRAAGNRVRGPGDFTVRAKHNFWGNDGGSHALGIMPFVVVPLERNDGIGRAEVEGGVILPFAAALPGGWGFGAMSEVDWTRDETGDVEVLWLNTATVGRDLTEALGGFVELTLEVGDGRPAATFNAGLTYAVTAELQLDVGANWGITRAAPDLGAFVGFSWRR